ncbi:copper resistance protein NlpE [Subsaxibacter sp. CAU 1640]|uniref:copper resistance protein NlpE N-terminal domain-containing protein n=1 Tax=Subsaxibacter sp. CAU 1640 TaxID=2933271 RepID=UPI002006BE60|nr:copper resistance protein NlpE N-terminal domain-containing protein [Subsaxibacter sp. CAU 1640]MCK7589630.1 copper resistance protein NlpE [Subsaxibacter sp. CAU 1640]
MKTYILLFAILFSSIFTYSQNIEGIYANKWLANSGEGIDYTLDLKADGTFAFIYKRIYINGSKDRVVEVEGTWVLDNHLLTLYTEGQTDVEIAKWLDENKARFVSVSPRHPQFNLIKPSLKFYESNIFYAKNMELIKTESSVTASE